MKRLPLALLSCALLAAGAALYLHAAPVTPTIVSPAPPVPEGFAPVVARCPAVIELARPADETVRDVDAIWARELDTVAAKVRLASIAEAALRSDVGQKLKLDDAVRKDLSSRVVTRVIPDSSLVEVWVNCSDDKKTCADATNAVVHTYLSQAMQDEARTTDARVERLNAQVKHFEELRDKLAAEIDKFIEQNGLDTPPAVTQPSDNPKQLQYAKAVRQLNTMQARHEHIAQIWRELKRRVLEITLDPPAPRLKLVQEAAQ